ncbi:MAG: 2-oxoglutarate dehydrogenase complex dihydrolipoyllysine-residue succinyltransferase [Phycisphaerae bacterium]|nr:2-oxoglutarate dehydrogenase complex dihydrolipoyllysine-residue succinyltransferase [Phycisphaerae bacterium]
MSVDLLIPSPGESIAEVRIGQWTKSDGEWVEKDEVLAEIESDKATLELRAPAAGVLSIAAASGADVKVGASVGTIDTAAARPASGGARSTPAAPAPAAPNAAGHAAPSSTDGGKATSLARKIAAEKGIDVGRLEGTGPSGRVTKADVLDAAEGRVAPRAGAAPSPATPGPTPPAPKPAPKPAAAPSAPPGSRGVRRERMTKLRLRIAERLVESKQTTAMLTTFNEADMTEVLRLREEHKDSFEKRHGVKLGLMSFFVKAAVSALRKYPRLNAFIAGEEIEHHDFVDMGIAVGTERGLVVPVLRNVESMSFAEVESTIRDVAVRARDGKLAVEEMTGGTFTITNGGVYGSLMATPILNPPQSGILGMHKIMKRAVEDPQKPGEIALRPMMYLALSYDHRIVDGQESVGFLVHVKECLEKPERLLLGL